ncbi:RAP2-like protein [Tripterygium wilfordii]|uniref:RAP2-like protein n=1 Tax=Tripterygium wilfordii TaxID=458696 RepID=A0A7J7BYT1_TRIWF|nr:ethylene-responsive transcription factor ERF019-like [Tripterygium wilfordii]KAF5727070.1 RAP2-like protein [Tripterygium wilfordii]
MNHNTSNNSRGEKKYQGVRRRKWGKWVSEIRVPGSQERLWLGTYSSPEAAAVAHDIAFFCLRGPDSIDGLNFPTTIPAGLRTDMSPRSVQRAASDAGMAIDARMVSEKEVKVEEGSSSCHGGVTNHGLEMGLCGDDDYRGTLAQGSEGGEALNISVEDYL